MGLDAIKNGVFAASELGLAGLAKKILNKFILAMLTIADKGMHFLISDEIIVAFLVGTEIVLGADLLFPALFAFDIGQGDGCFGIGSARCQTSIKRCAALWAILWGFGLHYLGLAVFGSRVLGGEELFEPFLLKEMPELEQDQETAQQH